MRILVAYRAIPDRAGWATGDLLATALEALGHTVRRYAKIYQRDAWLHDDCTADLDLIIYLECNDGDKQYNELAGIEARRVYWEFDTQMHVRWTDEFLATMRFDHVFMASQIMAEKFGATYLPYAADTEHFRPAIGDRFGAAIVGSPFADRVIFSQATGIPIYSGVYNEQYVELIQSLQAHVHFQSSGGDDLLVNRIWETMAVETPLVAQRQAAMDPHFVDGEHYLAFDDPAHCVALVQQVMADEVQAMRIAGAARAEIDARHTYAHRAKTILEIAS